MTQVMVQHQSDEEVQSAVQTLRDVRSRRLTRALRAVAPSVRPHSRALVR